MTVFLDASNDFIDLNIRAFYFLRNDGRLRMSMCYMVGTAIGNPSFSPSYYMSIKFLIIFLLLSLPAEDTYINHE